jgi:hypothetical protein
MCKCAGCSRETRDRLFAERKAEFERRFGTATQYELRKGQLTADEEARLATWMQNHPNALVQR